MIAKAVVTGKPQAMASSQSMTNTTSDTQSLSMVLQELEALVTEVKTRSKPVIQKALVTEVEAETKTVTTSKSDASVAAATSKSDASDAVRKALNALAGVTVNVYEGKEDWDLKRYAVLASICNLPDEKLAIKIRLHEFMDEMLRNFQQKTNASWLLYIPGMLHALGATDDEIEVACPSSRTKGKSKAVDLSEIKVLPPKGIQYYFKAHYKSMDTAKKTLIMAARSSKSGKSTKLVKSGKSAKMVKSANLSKATKHCGRKVIKKEK